MLIVSLKEASSTEVYGNPGFILLLFELRIQTNMNPGILRRIVLHHTVEISRSRHLVLIVDTSDQTKVYLALKLDTFPWELDLLKQAKFISFIFFIRIEVLETSEGANEPYG